MEVEKKVVEANSVLKRLLSRDVSERSEDVRGKIEQVLNGDFENYGIDTPWAEEWYRHLVVTEKDFNKLPRALKYLIEKIHQGVVFDLASGSYFNFTQNLCCAANVKTMVMSDLFRNGNSGGGRRVSKPLKSTYAADFNEKYPLIDMFDPSKPLSGMRIETLSDALDTISRVPDGDNVHVSVSGFEDCILDDPRYHELLAEEILRVLPVGNLVFGVNSEVLDILRKDSRVKEIPFPEREYVPVQRQLAYIFERV